MKRVEIKMELLRDIVSGLYHTGGFKTVEELIDHLTECSSAEYYLHVEDDQVIDVPHEVNRLTMKELEKMLTASESKVEVIGMDVGMPENDVVQVVGNFTPKHIPLQFPIGATNIKTTTPTWFGDVREEVKGVKVDAVFFDETRDDGPRPCMDCGFPTDQQNSQTMINGELRYRCDECEAKCDDRDEEDDE
jgi:hypothetical protein